jgi:hypothetical protein
VGREKVMQTVARRAGGREAGVALLEILIAGMILTIAISGLAAMFGLGQSLISGEGHERVAAYLAEQKMEEVRTEGVDALPSSIDTTPSVDTEAAGTIPSFPRFARVTRIERETAAGQVDNSGVSPPKRITITVTPVDRESDAEVVTLTGIMFPH